MPRESSSTRPGRLAGNLLLILTGVVLAAIAVAVAAGTGLMEVRFGAAPKNPPGGNPPITINLPKPERWIEPYPEAQNIFGFLDVRGCAFRYSPADKCECWLDVSKSLERVSPNRAIVGGKSVSLEVLAANTVGLLGSPLGQGPLLAAPVPATAQADILFIGNKLKYELLKTPLRFNPGPKPEDVPSAKTTGIVVLTMPKTATSEENPNWFYQGSQWKKETADPDGKGTTTLSGGTSLNGKWKLPFSLHWTNSSYDWDGFSLLNPQVGKELVLYTWRAMPEGSDGYAYEIKLKAKFLE